MRKIPGEELEKHRSFWWRAPLEFNTSGDQVIPIETVLHRVQ